ncbi:hypothetical protein ACF1BK_02370 [Streptomyces globisporus]|uniref:hypothetical protein n=1 Tax=Streptomyces globisporus TaxID=1908 RepID=UPI0036F622F9
MEKSGRPEKKRLFGLSLLLSILVLLLEATVALVVSLVYDVTQESPNAGGGGSAMFIFLLPVLAVFATAIAGALSVGLVFPTAWLSGVLGRRFGGRDMGWVPVAAGAVSLVIVAAVVALAGGAGAVPPAWAGS